MLIFDAIVGELALVSLLSFHERLTFHYLQLALHLQPQIALLNNENHLHFYLLFYLYSADVNLV